MKRRKKSLMSWFEKLMSDRQTIWKIIVINIARSSEKSFSHSSWGHRRNRSAYEISFNGKNETPTTIADKSWETEHQPQKTTTTTTTKKNNKKKQTKKQTNKKTAKKQQKKTNKQKKKNNNNNNNKKKRIATGFLIPNRVIAMLHSIH